MSMLFVHLLPPSPADDLPADSTAVVIDVLRASTTIVHALVNGARSVIPCESVDGARRIAARREAGQCVLGGERGGTRIDGFDLDNSPLAYTAATVGGCDVIFSTTNGTRAIRRTAAAAHVLIGSFVNRQAVARRLVVNQESIHLVCAGTNGTVAAEDVLFAGSLAEHLTAMGGRTDWLNDEARIAMDFYRANSENPARLLDTIRKSRGGRNLVKLGFEADIEHAAKPDLFAAVPEFDPYSGRIRLTLDS